MSAEKNLTVYAVREEDQKTSGIILCGLDQVRIQEILNVFRVKGARQTKNGLSREVNSLAGPARVQWSGSSLLLLVGNPHVGSRGDSDIHKLNVKPGDDLVTGPSGFYVSVDIKDQECLRGMKVLGDALARQPLSESVSLRKTDLLVRPSRRSHPLSGRLRALYYSLCSTGKTQQDANKYLKLVSNERREHHRRLRMFWRLKANRFISQTIMNRIETRSRISVIETQAFGAPALQFFVEEVPRFVPRPVQKSVRRLGRKLGHALLPATA
jgi:hypothetical protein